jgi:co-chaperonin GroES (HSP10)
MKPSEGRVIVEKVQNKSEFFVAGNDDYVVAVSGSKSYKKGDRVLFSDSHTYKYRGEEIIIVREEDIEAYDGN